MGRNQWPLTIWTGENYLYVPKLFVGAFTQLIQGYRNASREVFNRGFLPVAPQGVADGLQRGAVGDLDWLDALVSFSGE